MTSLFWFLFQAHFSRSQMFWFLRSFIMRITLPLLPLVQDFAGDRKKIGSYKFPFKSLSKIFFNVCWFLILLKQCLNRKHFVSFFSNLSLETDLWCGALSSKFTYLIKIWLNCLFFPTIPWILVYYRWYSKSNNVLQK